MWWAAKTGFDLHELDDVYAKSGSPFSGGGDAAEAAGASQQYGQCLGSPKWCWLTAHTITQTTTYGFVKQRQRDPNNPSTWGDAQLNWVHGYLHRLESDEANAAGWYMRGLKELSVSPVEEEWHSIVAR